MNGITDHTRHYLFEPNSFVPLAQVVEQDGQQNTAYYHVDHLGTPQLLSDEAGDIAWRAEYKAWGEAKTIISEAAQAAGIDNPLRFQGQYFDEESGLHYNRHRYYDPGTGWFISSDPIGLMGGVNTHAYAPNPVEWIDPLGLMPRFTKSEVEADLAANKASTGTNMYECKHCGFKNGNRVFAKSAETGRPVGDGSFHDDHFPVSNADGGDHSTGSRILGGTCNCSQGNGRKIQTTCMDKYPDLHDTNDTVTLNKSERKTRASVAKNAARNKS